MKPTFVISALLLSLCTMHAAHATSNVIKHKPEFCHELECPSFDVVDSADGYEKREYDNAVWVSTTVEAYTYTMAVPSGFKRLFNYIDGHNEDGVKIPMTSPVRVEVHPSTGGPFCRSNFTVSFFVPCDFEEDPPKPEDDNILISREGPATFYVSQSGGFVMDDFSLMRMAKRLTDALDADGVEYEDYFYFAGYDPPFRLKGRHNEIWIADKDSRVKTDAVTSS